MERLVPTVISRSASSDDSWSSVDIGTARYAMKVRALPNSDWIIVSAIPTDEIGQLIESYNTRPAIRRNGE